MGEANRLHRIPSPLVLAGFLGLCFLVAAFGSQFQPGEWYAQLRKPPWTPPAVVFAPVWSALYALMAVAAWLVWRRPQPGRTGALALFLFQLLLNGLWSWLFFGRQAPVAALVDLLLLWGLLLWVDLRFFRLNRLAGWLFLPYVLWVSYALTLNAGVVILNP